MAEIIDKFFEDTFAQCMLGWVLYFGSLCWIETNGHKLNVGGWISQNALQLILGVVVCFALVSQDDVIMKEFDNAGSVFPWYYYFCSGFALNIIFQIVKLVPKLSEYLIKKFSPIKD